MGVADRLVQHLAERVPWGLDGERTDISEALSAGVPSPRVLIVGAGLGGIRMAMRLRQAGIVTFTIVDKADGIGGVWRDNTYPGAACDVPSHLYSFSFRTEPGWSRRFAPQDEILAYLERCVADHGLTPHLRLGTEVAELTWDDDDERWSARTTDGEVLEAEVVVCALGQLNRPRLPDVPGRDDFAGTAFHSARWDHGHRLDGERVGVIGTGASAIQFVPPVAAAAGHTTVFQRTPAWVLPKRDTVYTRRQRWAFAHLPLVERAYRWWTYWSFEGRFTVLRRAGRLEALGRARFTEALDEAVVPAATAKGVPRHALVPDEPLGCKRLLQSNDWYPALLRDDVDVVTAPIERIVADGVVTADGVHHRLDTLIYGTGFAATDFLAPMRVVGRKGVELDEAWRDGARAYLGMAVAGFPNLFLLYGPNTNLGHNSIVFMLEAQIHWILEVVRDLVASNLTSVEVRPEAQDRDDAEVQAAAAGTVWAGDCRSWYKDASGRITNNWPHFTVEYWRRTRRVRRADLRRRARGVGSG